jgi:hypothetical protein
MKKRKKEKWYLFNLIKLQVQWLKLKNKESH